MALKVFGPRVGHLRTTRVTAPDKVVDPHYRTAEHQRWRAGVIARAGGRCEGRVDGRVCGRAEGRMFADHIVELRDGGAPLDPSNGQCLCGACHTRKTAEARRERFHGEGRGVF